MFDISSWKLIILAAIALIVVGPKDLPMLLRTLGKYMGIIKRQAAEFRAQFDEAMRESELSELRKEVESLGREAQATLQEAERSVDAEMRSIESEIERTAAMVDGEKPDGGAQTASLADASSADAGTAAVATDTVNGAVAGEHASPEPTAVAEIKPPEPAWPLRETADAGSAARSGA